MRQASLCIFQDPVAKGRAKFTRSGFLYTPAKTRKSEASIKTEMRSAFTDEPFDNAIKVKIIFNLKRPKSVKRMYPAVKPDIDNYIKQIFDSGNGILWVDDSLICSLYTTKQYSEGEAMIEINIEEICE